MDRLKELRNERRLLQKDIARVLQCSTTVYCRYENGSRETPKDVMLKLADFYGVSVDYLMGRDETTQQKSPAHMGEAELDEALIKALVSLSPQEAERVRDFVSGLIAARKE